MKNISPKEAFDMLLRNSDAIIVDVRTPEEWTGGIPADTNLKLVTISSNLDEFERNLSNAIQDKNPPILFICRGGTRSATAASIGEKLGYKNCYNITGAVSYTHLRAHET